MDKEFVNFAYMIFITPQGKGYGCFAIKKLAHNTFKVAASFCSPKDANKFDKRKARKIAGNRLNTEGCFIDLSLDDDIKDEFKTMHHKIFDSEMNIPNWAETAYADEAYSLTLLESNKSFYQLVEEFDLAQEFFKRSCERKNNFNYYC